MLEADDTVAPSQNTSVMEEEEKMEILDGIATIEDDSCQKSEEDKLSIMGNIFFRKSKGEKADRPAIAEEVKEDLTDRNDVPQRETQSLHSCDIAIPDHREAQLREDKGGRLSEEMAEETEPETTAGLSEEKEEELPEQMDTQSDEEDLHPVEVYSAVKNDVYADENDEISSDLKKSQRSGGEESTQCDERCSSPLAENVTTNTKEFLCTSETTRDHYDVNAACVAEEVEAIETDVTNTAGVIADCKYTEESLKPKSIQELRDICEKLRLKIKKVEESLKVMEDESSCLIMQADARYVAIDQLLDLCTYGTRDLDYYFRSVQMSVVIP